MADENARQERSTLNRWISTAEKYLGRLFSTGKENSGLENLASPVFAAFRELEVIVFKVDFLGDFVLAIPALTALKEKIKSEKIDIVVGGWNVDIARRTGLFRNIYTYNGLARHEIDRQTLPEEEKNLREKLPHYDLAIEFRRGKDTKNLMQWIHAACKIGTRSYKEAGQILDICLDADHHLHESLQMMRIVDSVPMRVLELPFIGQAASADFPRNVSIFPFAGTPMKEWPLENYVELARQLSEEPWVRQIGIFCSAQEAEKCRAFADKPKMEVFAQLPVDALITLLAESRIIISNDSFGAHLASYLHIPLIAIYSGQTRPLEWKPSFGPMTILRSDIYCSGCNSAKLCSFPRIPGCLQKIEPKDVLAEVGRLLARTAEKGEQTNKVILADSNVMKNIL